ncbi:MAG: dehydrogenase [Bacteroidetes bacterium]|nr:MAG: dehydrogenase [Bacteroidota bacterium]
MKQLLQNLSSGKTYLEDIPVPAVKSGSVLIQTTNSLVSLGTEKMLVEFGKASFIEKARKQPEKVKMVIDKVKTEGLMTTINAVRNKLDTPLPLGYCNVGTIIAIGKGVTEFQVGDRVASNGNHAEVVCVPKNLVAKIPDSISDEEAVFTVIGSIGLQGVRLVNPTIGETIIVVGLGLIGLISAQILKANGCRVIAYDLSQDKVDLAKSLGIIAFNSGSQDPVAFVKDYTDRIGADGVVITASANTDQIISDAANMCRMRGRVVLVGVVGLNLNRSDFYTKEISFQVSCSYGPGRYDTNYEAKGMDYPIGFVRWTEKRNFETILQLIATKSINVNALITERIDFSDFEKIYGNMGASNSVASIMKYSTSAIDLSYSTRTIHSNSLQPKKPIIGLLGAGNFSRMTMLPALKKANAQVKYIASAGGLNGTDLAIKYNSAKSTTDYTDILKDDETNVFIISTQHGSHSHFVTQGLEANKHVFVEKPLALNNEQLDSIVSAYEKSSGTLMVGFNRRFSPHSVKVKSCIGDSPIQVIATMNAGEIPPDVWVHDMDNGGGRIVGEACHFIDLISFFTGSKIVSVCMNALGASPKQNTDNASILLKYENGSTGVINYFSTGSKKYSKERIEVYSQNRTFIIDNFRKTEGFGQSGFRGLKTSIDKGHQAQFTQYLKSIEGNGKSIISVDSLINTSQASFAALESLANKSWVDLK